MASPEISFQDRSTIRCLSQKGGLARRENINRIVEAIKQNRWISWAFMIFILRRPVQVTKGRYYELTRRNALRRLSDTGQSYDLAIFLEAQSDRAERLIEQRVLPRIHELSIVDIVDV